MIGGLFEPTGPGQHLDGGVDRVVASTVTAVPVGMCLGSRRPGRARQVSVHVLGHESHGALGVVGGRVRRPVRFDGSPPLQVSDL